MQLLSCGNVTIRFPLLDRAAFLIKFDEFTKKYCLGKKRRVVDLNGPAGGTQIGARGVLNAYLAATEEQKPWTPNSFRLGAPGTKLDDPQGVKSSVANRFFTSLGLRSPLEAICGGPDPKDFISCGPFLVKLKPSERNLTLRELINGPCCDGRQWYDGGLRPITTPPKHPRCGALSMGDWFGWSGPKRIVRPLPPTTRGGGQRRRVTTIDAGGAATGAATEELAGGTARPPTADLRRLVSCGPFLVELAPGETIGSLRELILGPCSDGRPHYDGAGNQIP